MANPHASILVPLGVQERENNMEKVKIEKTLFVGAQRQIGLKLVGRLDLGIGSMLKLD